MTHTACTVAAGGKICIQNTSELREKFASGLEQIGRGEALDGRTALQNLRTKLKQH